MVGAECLWSGVEGSLDKAFRVWWGLRIESAGPGPASRAAGALAAAGLRLQGPRSCIQCQQPAAQPTPSISMLCVLCVQYPGDYAAEDGDCAAADANLLLHEEGGGGGRGGRGRRRAGPFKPVNRGPPEGGEQEAVI